MNDKELKSRLQRAYRSADAAPPDFDSMWEAAAAQSSRRFRYRAIAAGIAVMAAVTVISVSQWSGEVQQNDAWIADLNESLLNTTAWSAPSDVLLPRDEFDLYSTLPTLIESTDMEFETLL